jgi:hypothetical protein
MAPAAAFAEVLDACMDRYESRGPAAAGRSQSRVATRSLFWFEGATAPVPTGQRLVRSGTSRRPAPQLSPRQLDALRQLAALGARLEAGFTAEELRSAFRVLARAYHPDQHPGATPSERTRLSAAFVAAHEAYGLLKMARSR